MCNLSTPDLRRVYMKRLFFSIILILGAAQSIHGSLLVIPRDGCGFFIDAAVEGIYVEEPNIGFYGLVSPDDTPAAVYDPSFLTARVTGTVGATCEPNDYFRCFGNQLYAYVSTSYFQCSEKQNRDLNDGSDIQLFAIDGNGEGGTLPSTQKAFFDACHQESHTEAMLASTQCMNWGFDLFYAVGFGFIYRHQEYKSNLQNTELIFDNGTVTETLSTYYRGVKLELGIIKRFCGCWTLSVVPTFGIYTAHTDFEGDQTWGMLGIEPFSLSRTYEQTAYQGALRASLIYDWCGYYVGGQAFADYLSFIPGVFNPREDDDGAARITEKNSFRYGGGFVMGTLF